MREREKERKGGGAERERERERERRNLKKVPGSVLTVQSSEGPELTNCEKLDA